MDRVNEKRRGSILKKRRSRSLSPKSPQERAVRRASRRISFSGKHNVREYFTSESTATAWGDTYDVSTDKHILSNEQIALQSTRLSSMSVTSQTTRNDSVVMDISAAASNVMSMATKNVQPSHEKVVNFKPASKVVPNTIAVHDKENIAVLDDIDLTLDLPPPAPPTKSFLSNFGSTILSSLHRPSYSMVESSGFAEKTSGSDNMDISGVEPTDQNEIHTKWLKSENSSLSKKQQKSINQIDDIQLDETPINALPIEQPKAKVSLRKTINQPLEMSLEAKNQSKLKDVSGAFSDMSIEVLPEQGNHRHKAMNATNAIDMEMSHLKASSTNQGNLTEETFKKPISRRTVNISHDITTDDFDASKPNSCNRTVELSVQYIGGTKHPSEMEMPSFVKPNEKSFRKPSNRQTVQELYDITIDDNNASNVNKCNRANEMSIQLITSSDYPKTLLQAQDIELSYMQKKNGQAQPATGAQDISLDSCHNQSNSEQHNLADIHAAVENRSSRRQTILHHHDMDLDSPTMQLNEVMAPPPKQQNRQTINKPHNISVDSTEKQPDAAKVVVPFRRQTTHTVQDISLDTSTTQSNALSRDNSKPCVRDISLDEIQASHSPAIQHDNLKWKKDALSTGRLTMNEPRDMSLDSNASGKSNIYSRYNKSILGNTSMELQSTGVYSQMINRRSVICKSPSKNVTIAAFDRSSLEFTKLIDQNNLSHHPLHSTKLYDINCSKFTDFELNATAEGNSSESNEPASAAPSIVSFKPTQDKTNRGLFDLDISDESSPIPTAKKFNLNKTPYYAGLDVESDSSALELTANNFNDEMLFEPKRNEQQSIASTKIFHATINVDSSHLSVAPETLAQSMELGGVSPASVPLERPMSMNMNFTKFLDNSKRSSMPDQSLFQLTSIGSPIQIDDSISDSRSSSAPSNLINTLIGANDSAKQLTFIEDDDDEEQICNTKIDLASSLENSDNESIIAGMIGIVKPLISSTSALITSIDQSNPSLCEELNAFKKSNRLRHSNVFASKEMANKYRIDADTLNDESSNDARSKDNTLTDIGQSQIMQRRSSSATANDEANETSFLKKRPDKKASEVKLDFSGHDELAGLATPMDVFEDFLKRMDQIERQNEIWAEQYRKFEAGEIDSFDDNNNEDLNSQNVEAPSWTVLCKNKLQVELEEHQREWEREWNERLPGAHLPAIPCMSLTMLEKCRQLNHWNFNDVWYFDGNIHLCNKEMLAFQVCLVYDPKEIEKHSESYGALKFDHIEYEFCNEQLKVRYNPIFLLEKRELESKLPRDLTTMCKSSTNLSEFDEKLHGYCVRARQKVKKLKQIWRKNKALIKEENGTIYIMKTMFDFKNYDSQDFIIKLDNIDTTDWHNVLTNPRRALNEEIKSLPNGVAFIEELLTNCSKYVPWQ